MTAGVHIVLQARVNSTRLPGKALLPVAGWPSALLAALRAGNTGLPLTLATSDDPANDPLAAAAGSAGVAVFRGSEQDVLGRFAAATAALSDQTVIVRLTADNMFPDGDFVRLLVDSLGDADIVGTASAATLPYGLSGEAFRLAALRRAAAEARSPYDREHVTPWLYRNGPNAIFDTLDGEFHLSCLRCTLDVAEDYEVLKQVFAGVDDPVRIGWRGLVQRLANLPDAPKACVPRNRRGGPCLVLGTAQLGAPYGSVRKTVAPSPEQSTALVRAAIRHGITEIDTARAYPQSEQRIGLALAGDWRDRARVITKLTALNDYPANASEVEIVQAVDASIAASRQALCVDRLPMLLLHRATHLTAWNGAAWDRVRHLHRQDVIGALGVSIQSPEEARQVLAVAEIKHIQLACNILDTRWERAAIPALLASRPDVTVHARSALLQGVLRTADPQAWPRIENLDVSEIAGWLTRMAGELERRDVIDLCYAWLRAQSWIDAVVVGMEEQAQVADNAALFARPALASEGLAHIAASRPAVPEQLLNPAFWPAP